MVRLAYLSLAAAALVAGPASAQYVIVHSPPPVLVRPAPVVTYPAPVTVYSAPVVTYAPPAVAPPVTTYSYYAPTTTYSYYPPATTVYSAPAVVVPGYYATRTYVGFGIFRPRGVHTETYFVPR